MIVVMSACNDHYDLILARMCHFIICIKNDNKITKVLGHCCCGCLWSSCGCGQALPVNKVTIVANLKEHVHNAKDTICIIQTNKKVDQNRAEEKIMYTSERQKIETRFSIRAEMRMIWRGVVRPRMRIWSR